MNRTHTSKKRRFRQSFGGYVTLCHMVPSSSSVPLVAIPRIPETECWIAYARSSGPGGQNVNKRETKAVVRWQVDNSTLFTTEQKHILHGKLANRISGEGYLLVDAEGQRSRDQNRQSAMRVLNALVQDALTPDTERVPTKPSRASKRKRLDSKHRHSRQKQLRKPSGVDE